MRIGYARASTPEQAKSLEAQCAALNAAGCQKVFSDIASGAKADRPGLRQVTDYAREGDVLVVSRLDRLGRTTLDTLRTLADLDAAGIHVIAQDIGLDTSTPSGRMIITVILALGQWERETMIERTQEGLAHARAQGRVGGRPRKLSDEQVQAIRAALDADMGLADLAAVHGVSTRTISRVKGGSY